MNVRNTLKFGSFLILTLSLSAATSLAQANQYEAVKGSETPQYSHYSDAGNCFVFADYIVKTDHINADGENISVFKRPASTNAKTGCSVKGKAYFYTADADNSSFYGIYGNFLFVDSGTSVDSRGLNVYDLVSRKSV